MIYKNRFLLHKKYLQMLNTIRADDVLTTFATLDLDDVGKIHGVWGRGGASYVIKLYEIELLELVKKLKYEIFVYARGDEFEIITTAFTADELSKILENFRASVLKKHTGKHFVEVMKKPSKHIYRGSNFRFTEKTKASNILDLYNNGKLFFPNFSAGIVQGTFEKDENIVSVTDSLRFFATIALTEAKLNKGTTVIYPKSIEDESAFGKEYRFTRVETKVRKFKKKLKRNLTIDDHHISLINFDHLMTKNPYAGYKKYLLIEFLWKGEALEELARTGFDLRGGTDGYGFKGLIKLLDPNALYYIIAQNMDSAVKVLNAHNLIERNSKMTRFLDRMEVYFNNKVTEEELSAIVDEIGIKINEQLASFPLDIQAVVFMTFKRASKARKTSSFRSYLEYVSKLATSEDELWKIRTNLGNVVAMFNPELLDKIVEYQTKRAEVSYTKLISV